MFIIYQRGIGFNLHYASYIKELGDPGCNVSYWIVPGTVES